MKDVRSWHFVPAHRSEYLERARHLPADLLVFDLEDGVPIAEKERARRNLRDRLPHWSAEDRRRCYVRVNSEEEEFRADLAVLRQIAPSGVVLPKVEDSRMLRSRCRVLSNLSPDMGLVVLIESFRAVSELAAILDAAAPLSAVGLGLEDLLADIDVPRSEAALLATHVRLNLVVEAKARNIPCIDSVSLEYRNQARFRRECVESRSLGFDGMFSIHPSQIETINAAFAPRRGEVRWAAKIRRISEMKDGTGYTRVGRRAQSAESSKGAAHPRAIASERGGRR